MWSDKLWFPRIYLGQIICQISHIFIDYLNNIPENWHNYLHLCCLMNLAQSQLVSSCMSHSIHLYPSHLAFTVCLIVQSFNVM